MACFSICCVRLSARERFEYRSAAAMTLRDFDANLRRLRVKTLPYRMVEERRVLTRTLTSLGGQAWPYSSSGDNSWVT